MNVRHLHKALGFVALALAVRGAPAQSINIDFGASAGVPDSSYAAAGYPGVWNCVEPPAEPEPEWSQTLVDLSGAPTDVQITLMPAPATMLDDDPATSGGDHALFDDFVPGLGDVVISAQVIGLEPGTYDVDVYGWIPNAPDRSCLVFIDEGVSSGAVLTGAWPGEPVEGVTHLSQRVEIPDGTLDINMVGGTWGDSGVLNGLQVRFVPAPVASDADFDGDGVVGMSDLTTLLIAWTSGHGCDGVVPGKACPGDVDQDQGIGFSDLALLLLFWG